MAEFHFDVILGYLLEYGIIGILAFLFLVLAVRKFISEDKNDKFTNFLLKRNEVKEKKEDLVLKRLDELEIKINTLIQISTKLNENLNYLSRQAQDERANIAERLSDSSSICKDLDTTKKLLRDINKTMPKALDIE